MTLTDPRPATAPLAPRERGRRQRIAALERPLLCTGLALVALHLLDLAFSGPDTSLPGLVAIVAAPVGWALAQPHVTRPTRLAFGVVIGLLTFGFGVISHGLHVVNSGPDWPDVTGLGMIAGGLLLVAAGLAALDGRELSGWYVPTRNRTAVLLSHGSGGSRERVTAHVRMLARHGYGVLALDNPGNGESEGHSNGLGDNAQPAIDAALGWLSSRPDVDPRRIAGIGTSLGAEVLLEAAARHAPLRAVVADGPTPPMDGRRAGDPGPLEQAFGTLWQQSVRGISGMRESPSLIGLMPRIAPRPVLLIAGGVGAPDEIPANRLYRDAGGSTVRLWELPDAGHTAGRRTHPAAYERRTTAFLDSASISRRPHDLRRARRARRARMVGFMARSRQKRREPDTSMVMAHLGITRAGR